MTKVMCVETKNSQVHRTALRQDETLLLINARASVSPDRKTTEERSSSKKDKLSEGDAAPVKATSEAEPMETEAAATAAASGSSPLLNGQQELLHSEGDTQSN